jgi:DNA-binding SARP family transcriptional activator
VVLVDAARFADVFDLRVPAGVPEPPGLPEARARHRVTLLGGFQLTVDDRTVAVPASTQRIISMLALRGRTGRSRLAGSLWPETTEMRALASLRTAIWRANQTAPGLVDSAHDSVDLAADVEVDVARLVQTAHDVMDGRATAGIDGPALRYVEGDLLPDWNDDWLVVDRERLRQLRLHVLETLAGQLALQGMFGMAMEAALAALRADALRESAHRTVIRIHLAEGNIAEAMHAYDECCAVLAREIGLAPSAETVQLMRTVELRRAPRSGPATLRTG